MNSYYKEYSRLAFRRALLASLQRYVLEHVSSETPATKQIISDEVLAADRELPPEAYMDMLEELQQQEAEVRLQMSQYEFRRKPDVSRKQEAPAEAKPEVEREVAPERKQSGKPKPS